jgi:hypothetical protein
MKVLFPRTLAALALLTSACPATYAQNPYGPGYLPNQRPAISPYLNLYRGGQSPSLNYFTLVRPEFNALNTFQGIQQQQTLDQQAITDLRASNALPVTGHVPTFLNTGGYFPGRGGAGRGGIGGGGGIGGAGVGGAGGFSGNLSNTGARSPALSGAAGTVGLGGVQGLGAYPR